MIPRTPPRCGGVLLPAPPDVPIRPLALGLALLGAGLLASPAAADEPTLLERADASALHRDPVWRALLHVVRAPLSWRARSEVPDSAFFLASDGRDDPRAELRATLAALLAPPLPGDDAIHCRFPARTRWLARALEVSLDELAPAPCPAFDEWRSQLDPRGITLIFPEAFMNNPASAFGHTLLRLDVADPASPKNLLAYAIDFTANSGGDAGPVFLLRGVLGRYPGFFGLNPYYQKLGFYSDAQSRDIWEYPLALAADEIERLLLHLWELDGIEIPYFFFRANCSYQLVRLLEVARPGIPLRHGFPFGVIPVDTVRDVENAIGFSAPPRYRPSPATALRSALGELPAPHAELAISVGIGERSPDDAAVALLDPALRGQVLGVAVAIHQFRFESGEVAGEDARAHAFALLRARSLAPPGRLPEPPVPAARPEEGHDSALVSLAGGVDDGDRFAELRIRPAFHTAIESTAGFRPDTSLSFLDLRLRWFPGSGRIRLHELVLAELESLSPRDRFFEPVSWRVGTGLRTRRHPRQRDGALDRQLVWRSEGGVGWTLANESGSLRGYALLDARLEIGSVFDPGFTAGPGIELGVHVDAGRYGTRLSARTAHGIVGERFFDVEARWVQRLRLARRTALVLDAGWTHSAGASWSDARLEWQWTF